MGRIRNSAKALIIKDGKMAAIKIRDAGEEWYIMPGGGQEAEETLNEAVCREVSEELGIAIPLWKFWISSGWKRIGVACVQKSGKRIWVKTMCSFFPTSWGNVLPIMIPLPVGCLSA